MTGPSCPADPTLAGRRAAWNALWERLLRSCTRSGNQTPRIDLAPGGNQKPEVEKGLDESLNPRQLGSTAGVEPTRPRQRRAPRRAS
jgi:hypothetical protein